MAADLTDAGGDALFLSTSHGEGTPSLNAAIEENLALLRLGDPL